MSKCRLIKNGFYWDPKAGVSYCCASDENKEGVSSRQRYDLDRLDDFLSYALDDYEKSKEGWLPGCYTCENQESFFPNSMRTRANATMRRNGIKEDDDSKVDVVIKTSNVCNLACRMCSPSNSTKWSSVLRNNNALVKPGVTGSHEISQQQLDIILDKVINGKLTNLLFSGGEVLLSEWNQRIIEHLYKNNITKIECIVTTNATLKLNDSWKKSLNTFENTVIDISIDGFEDTFDYIRHGHSWHNLVENINHYKQALPNATFKYNYVAQAYNYHSWIYDIKQIEKLFKDCKTENKTFNICFYPAYLSPDILPPVLFEKYDLKRIVSEHRYDRDLAKQFFRQSAWMDTAMNTNLKELNPDFFDTQYYDQDLINVYYKTKQTQWVYKS